MAAYDGVLFDHDGVLVTLCGKPALHEATADAFRDAGISDPRREDLRALAIRVSDAELRAVADRHGVDPDRLWHHRETRIEDLLRAETTAGRKFVYDDVHALDRLDLPLGVVSNNQARIVEFVLDHHGLADHFETVRARDPTRDSLRRKKPDPLYLEQATADLGCQNPLYVGDSESDIRAGKRAGYDVAFLRREHNADRTLDATPTYDVESLTAVRELV